MGSQVRYTSNGIALDFDVRAEHLANERLQAAEFDDEKLVLGCVRRYQAKVKKKGQPAHC